MTAGHDAERSFARSLRLLLGVGLCGIGGLKLATGHSQGFWLSATPFYASSVFEIVCGLALIARQQVMAVAGATILLCIAGILLALLQAKPCGCLGQALLLNRHQHGLMTSLVGGLACLLAWSTAHPRGESPRNPRQESGGSGGRDDGALGALGALGAHDSG